MASEDVEVVDVSGRKVRVGFGELIRVLATQLAAVQFGQLRELRDELSAELKVARKALNDEREVNRGLHNTVLVTQAKLDKLDPMLRAVGAAGKARRAARPARKRRAS